MGLKARWLVLPLAVPLAVASCSGARHRKVAGPPPEYDLPEEPDGWPPPTSHSPASETSGRDAGTR